MASDSDDYRIYKRNLEIHEKRNTPIDMWECRRNNRYYIMKQLYTKNNGKKKRKKD